MAKQTIPVDREKLLNAIAKAEAEGPLVNQTELFKKIAEIYGEEKVTYSVIGLRIRDWKLEVKTPKGRKGAGPMTEERKAAMQAARGNRKSKAEKFESSDVSKKALDDLQEHVRRGSGSERFFPLIEQVRKGSRSAAVKLHCLDCSCYQTGEVRRCPCTTCSLWLFRPYQGAGEVDEIAPEEAEPSKD